MSSSSAFHNSIRGYNFTDDSEDGLGGSGAGGGNDSSSASAVSSSSEGVQIINRTGSFAPSDDGLEAELTQLGRAEDEIRREVENVDPEMLLDPTGGDDTDNGDGDGDGSGVGTPSRPIAVGRIPSDGADYSSSEAHSTPDRVLDFSTPPRDASDSNSGSIDGSESNDSAIAELRSVDRIQAGGAVGGAGGDESVVSAVSVGSGSISGYSLMRGTIPPSLSASDAGSSPTKSLRSVSQSLRRIGSGRSSRGKGSPRSNDEAEDKSRISSPARSILSKSAALGAAAAGGVAAAVAGIPMATSAAARSALNIGGGGTAAAGSNGGGDADASGSPQSTPKSEAEKPGRSIVEGGTGAAGAVEARSLASGRTPSATSPLQISAVGAGGEVAAVAASAGASAVASERGDNNDGDDDDVIKSTVTTSSGRNQVKWFAIGCAIFSLIMIALLSVALSVGFAPRSQGPDSGTGPTTSAPTPYPREIVPPAPTPTVVNGPPTARLTTEPTAGPRDKSLAPTLVVVPIPPVSAPTDAPVSLAPTPSPTTASTSSPTATTPSTLAPSTPKPSTVEPSTPVPSTPKPSTAAPTVSSSGAPSSTPTIFEAERYIRDISPDGGEAIDTPGTPQFDAYNWLLSNPGVDEMSKTELDQRYSLATMYYSMGLDESPVDLEGWMDAEAPECEWFGVICASPAASTSTSPPLRRRQQVNSAGGVIFKVQLFEIGLKGVIPAEILLMYDLKVLQLYGNELIGPLPPSIGNLTRLEVLELDSNKIDGQLPQELGGLPSLQTMRMELNYITGTMPESFRQLTALKTLRVDHNLLTGPIPDIGSLSLLEELRLDTNRFTGEIPNQLGNLKSAEHVTFHRNYLQGTMPLSMCLLTFERLTTLTSDCTGDQIQCLCCSLCSTGYPEEMYNEYTGWNGYPPVEAGAGNSEDGGSVLP